MRWNSLLAVAGLLALCIGLALMALMGGQALTANGIAFSPEPLFRAPSTGKLVTGALAGLAFIVAWAKLGATARVQGLSSGFKVKASTSLSVFLRRIRVSDAQNPAAVGHPTARVPQVLPLRDAPAPPPSARTPAPEQELPACPLCGTHGSLLELYAPLIKEPIFVCRGCRPRFESGRLDWSRLTPRELEALLDDRRLAPRIEDETFLLGLVHLYEGRGLLKSLLERPVFHGSTAAVRLARAVELVVGREPAPVAQETVPPGTVLHQRYRIIKPLGRGGYGPVFLAEDLKRERHVAVRRVPEIATSTAAVREALVREATAAWKMGEHEHIARLHKVVLHGSRIDLVSEFVAGTSLSALLAARGRFPPAECAVFASRILAALVWAHEQGVVHRALRPCNIVQTPAGGLKVLDFGVARDPRAESGEAGRQGDLYAFGATLHECLSGSPPSAETDTPLPEAVPENLRRMVHACLQSDLGTRAKSAIDLDALLAAKPA